MGDVATLVTALTGLVTALTGLIGAVVVLVKMSRKERPRAARNLAAELAEAAKDGEITADELRRIAGEDDKA